MTTTHRITKGLDLKLVGAPEPTVVDASEPLMVGLEPAEFPDVKPKLMVEEGEVVRTGQAIFRDKNDPDLRFVSPVTGKVAKLVYGERRLLLRVEISPQPGDEHAPEATVSADELLKIDRRELIVRLKHAGLWQLLRQRPIGRLVRGDRVPAAVFVNGMDTEPLACDPALAVRGSGEAFQAGIEVLRRLAEGNKVYLAVRDAVVQPSEFLQAKGVETHSFAGPHPAGLVGTHIAAIRPLGSGEIAYAIKAADVVLIGQWILSGHYPTHRIVAVAGSAAPVRKYFRVRLQAAAMTLTGGKPLSDDVRLIAGTVLSGTKIAGDGYLGLLTQTLTCIPEGIGKRDLFGWITPQFSRLSASRAVLSWLAPKKEYEVDARLHGGHRPIVNIGTWEAMTPLDIHPTFLMRAIEANDLEEALHLGLLEVTEEDLALCTFADPCKIDIGPVIRRGLDMVEEEGGV
ncbi:MAG: NADH:ubiquinone reductase (Na(+)-transporting) subunit A [Planctomycetota bacterium]